MSNIEMTSPIERAAQAVSDAIQGGGLRNLEHEIRVIFSTIDRDELAELFTSPVHAPVDTHSRLDGSCTECPWPLIQLPPEEIADAVLAWLTGKEHS